MTFWTYIFANTILSLAVAAILIWTKPENRAKRAEAKMRREEDLFNMILEAAKRIDEERKPNPDFTPPPEKKPPKPPTTGTNVIEPKPHGYHLTMTTYDAKDYGKTHTFNGEEYERTMVAQSADGSVVSMIYIRKHPQPKPYPHDIEALKASLDEWKCEPPMHIPTEGAKEHKCDKYSCLYSPFCNLTREQVLDGLDRYIKDIHLNDLLDRVEKKPVTPERLKEAGFTVAPVHSCGSCYWFGEGGGGKFGLCIRNDEIADRDGQKACFDPQERRSKVRPKPIGTVTTY